MTREVNFKAGVSTIQLIIFFCYPCLVHILDIFEAVWILMRVIIDTVQVEDAVDEM